MMVNSFTDSSPVLFDCELIHLDLNTQFHIPITLQSCYQEFKVNFQRVLELLKTRQLNLALDAICVMESQELPECAQMLNLLLKAHLLQLQSKLVQSRECTLYVFNHCDYLRDFAAQSLGDSYFCEGRFSLAQNYYLTAVELRQNSNRADLIHRSLLSLSHCQNTQAA